MELESPELLLVFPLKQLRKAIHSCKNIHLLTDLWNKIERVRNHLGSMGQIGSLSYEDLSSLQVEINQQQALLVQQQTLQSKAQWLQLTNRLQQRRSDEQNTKQTQIANRGRTLTQTDSSKKARTSALSSGDTINRATATTPKPVPDPEGTAAVCVTTTSPEGTDSTIAAPDPEHIATTSRVNADGGDTGRATSNGSNETRKTSRTRRRGTYE